MKNITKFNNSDKSQTLTVSALQGKTGYNVRASYKLTKTARAQTGCRATFTTAAEAQSAFDALCAECVKRGWTAVERNAKQSFTELPMAQNAVEPTVETVEPTVETIAPKLSKAERKAARKAAAQIAA